MKANSINRAEAIKRAREAVDAADKVAADAYVIFYKHDCYETREAWARAEENLSEALDAFDEIMAYYKAEQKGN